MINEIKEALEKATAGPWTSDPLINGYGVKSGNYINQIALITEGIGLNRDRDKARNNANLIANTPTYIRYLLDELEKVQRGFEFALNSHRYVEGELEKAQKENAAMKQALQKIGAVIVNDADRPIFYDVVRSANDTLFTLTKEQTNE